MKLSITDQFLLDVLYPFIDASGDMAHFLLSNKYQRVRILLGNENPVFQQYRKNRRLKHFRQFVYYLKKHGYITAQNLKGTTAIMLTKEGLDKALKASFKAEKRKKRKDGKWIMIAFDVPQKHSKARNLLRSVLKNLGYKLFQQSVWVSPYDVSEKTEAILQHYALDRYIKIFLIEEM